MADTILRATGEYAWQERAACRGADPEIFFPSPSDGARCRAAKRLCRECPVRVACLAFALRGPETHGIWGGLTIRERIRLTREQQQRVCDLAERDAGSVGRQPDEAARHDDALDLAGSLDDVEDLDVAV